MIQQISRIRTHFFNMKLRIKALLVFLLIGVLPFLCYIILSKYYTNQRIIERERVLTELSLNQALTSIENELETYNNLSNYMFNNTSILNALNTEYQNKYFQMYKAYQDVIEPLFQTYYALHPDLDQITIYSSCDLHPYNGYVQSYSKLCEKDWFPQISGLYIPTWTIREEDGQTILSSTRLIGDTRKYRSLNYLYLQVNYESLFAPLYTVSEGDYRILVTDKNNSPIFTNISDSALSLDAFLSQYSGKGYMLLTSQIAAPEWTVYFSKSYASLTDYADSITDFIYAFGWIILFFLGVMIALLSVFIISPIETLISKIQEMQQGDISTFHVELKENRKDEIGILFQSFSQMIEQIQHYIKVNLKNELEKKNYQQKILYAQINPHFLYNSLSLINSRAILSGQDDISHIVILLSTFYRTALNKGRDTTTLENELQNIQAYIQIQLLSYSEKIDVIYDIDYSLPPVTFPNFILQPLVENALDHGLKNSLREDKELRITVRKETNAESTENDFYIIIRIEDNGVGMDEETVASLFQLKTSGYGIKNVNDRLKLLYKENYTLTIHSTPGKGTQTELKLPSTL